jgi:hypothetical protein
MPRSAAHAASSTVMYCCALMCELVHESVAAPPASLVPRQYSLYDQHCNVALAYKLQTQRSTTTGYFMYVSMAHLEGVALLVARHSLHTREPL